MSTREHNIPGPWTRHKWPAGADIGRLASAVGNVLVSGPTNTQFPQLHGSHAIDRAERLARRDRVSPYRSRRLASMSQGNPELATLSPGTRYPNKREKQAERALYTQPWSLFTPERKSILAQGPFGIVKRVMSALGV